MEELKNKYCRHCGEELILIDVPADQVEVHHYDSGGGTWWDLDTTFNELTGTRNMALVAKCPNYKRKWYWENHHDIMCEYGDEVLFGVRIKSSWKKK